MQKHVRQRIGYLFLSFLLLMVAKYLWIVMMETNTMGSSCSSGLWNRRYIIEGKLFHWFLEGGYPCRYTLISFAGFYLYFTMFYLLYKAIGDRIFSGKLSWRRDILEVTFFFFVYWGALLSEIKKYVSSLSSEALIYSFAGSLTVIWLLCVLALMRHFIVGLKINAFLKGFLLLALSYLFLIIAATATIVLLHQ